jgi:hypothetical protein
MPSPLETCEIRGFAREIKFLVSPACAEAIRLWARGRMQPDPHAGGPDGDCYQISSLYFDTPQFDVYHRHGSHGRAKFRIRRYDESKHAFLERKLKSRSVVGKRRSIVKVKELSRIGKGQPDRNWTGFWFYRRLMLRGLRPVCQISYTRTARVAEDTFGVIRLTLDQDLFALPASGLGFNTVERGVAMTDEHVIVEMKYRREMPALFQEIVQEFGLTQQPLSKYRLAAGALGLTAEAVA